MKKGLWFVVFSLWLIAVSANDTLTRAQVYNFNVGDTFDYEISGGGINNPIPYSFGYERQIVEAKYYSSGLDTLFLILKTVYPTPVSFDTMILNDLPDFEIFLRIDSL